MKSAYELAMERLEKDDPNGSVKLTDEQREALAEIEKKYQAKKAEKEVFLNKQILESRKKGDREAVEQIEKQLRNEKARLDDEMEKEKDRIREAAS